VFYDMLATSIKEMIWNITMISTTLDKATVNGVSFTVICTYLFWQGQLKVFLNDLFLMSTENFYELGAAKMLCDCLTSTLGLGKEELTEKLEHIVFNSVYVNTVDRV